MHKIIVAHHLVDQINERLGDVADQVELLGVDRQAQGADIGEASAALRWDLNDEAWGSILERAPTLRWVHSVSAGVERWPLDEIRQRKLILTNGAGVFAIPIAEWVLNAMLMSAKRSYELHDAQRNHQWRNDVQSVELYDQTLLILGTGGIGQEVARRAAGFSMRIWGYNRSGAAVEHIERIVSGTQWRDLLPDADFVVSTLPLTPQTRDMFGAAEIDRMKSTAWFINVGRGATTDEPGLLQAIRNGAIGGAAIDAWVKEPLPADHPAWTTPNLIMSPHRSGSSLRTTERILALFTDNIRRFVHGQELRNQVDVEAGY